MIVVIGNPVARTAELGGGVEGVAARTALAVARAGVDVQLVGKIGEDPAGDAVLMALAAGGVGHVAMLRDPTRPTPVAVPGQQPASAAMLDGDDEPALAVIPADPREHPALEPADVELALRYLPDQRVIVVAEPQPEAVVAVVAEAAQYGGAQLVVVASPGSPHAGDAIVVEPPAESGGMFASLLGELAVLLERGSTPDEALRRLAALVGAVPTGE
jgi:ribokinase